jgi:hypothetical protein
MAQVVTNANMVDTQLNIKRDEKGFEVCGVRVIASVLDKQSSSFAYDVSINVWRDIKGLIKTGQQLIPLDKSGNWDLDRIRNRTPAPDYFWIGKRDENFTLKPTKLRKTATKGFVLADVDGDTASKYIAAILAEESIQISLHYPKDRNERVVSFKAEMNDDDKAAIHSCFAGLMEQLKQAEQSKE